MNVVNIIMGDFNTKIGKGKVIDIIGDFGLGEKNERGESKSERGDWWNFANIMKY